MLQSAHYRFGPMSLLYVMGNSNYLYDSESSDKTSCKNLNASQIWTS